MENRRIYKRNCRGKCSKTKPAFRQITTFELAALVARVAPAPVDVRALPAFPVVLFEHELGGV